MPLEPGIRDAVKEDNRFAFATLDIAPNHAFIIAWCLHKMVGEPNTVEDLNIALLVYKGDPPALPGRQQKFDIYRSRPSMKPPAHKPPRTRKGVSRWTDQTLAQQSRDANITRHLLSRESRRIGLWLELGYCGSFFAGWPHFWIVGLDRPLRAAPYLKPPALPGDTYLTQSSAPSLIEGLERRASSSACATFSRNEITSDICRHNCSSGTSSKSASVAF